MLSSVSGCGGQTHQDYEMREARHCKRVLSEGVGEAMLLLLSSVIDTREVSGGASICKPQLGFNAVIALDEGS